MGSIMKMFKGGNKKNGNKENVPAVTFNTTMPRNHKNQQFGQVYTGEPRREPELSISNPYSVITAPKKTKGPRSCPGAPMETDFNGASMTQRSLIDRKSLFNNSMRYENVRANETRRTRDDAALLERRSDYGSGSGGPSPTDFNREQQLQKDRQEQHYRNMMARRQYDNMYESDEDEVYEAHIKKLESKMQRMQRRMFEERAIMTRQIESLQDDSYHLKKSHDRMHRHYTQMKAQLETEKKQKSELLKMLHEANDKIAMLEADVDQQTKNMSSSSLLCIRPGHNLHGTVNRGSEGAGEALCFPEMSSLMTSSLPQGFASLMANNNGMNTTSTMQHMLVNPMSTSLDDDMEAQDEVRIFRTVERSGANSPLEIAREYDGSSPFDLSETKNERNKRRKDAKRGEESSGGVTRSHSDSDLFGGNSSGRVDIVEVTPDGVERDVEYSRMMAGSIDDVDRPRYERNSTWLKRNSATVPGEGSSSGSDDDMVSLIERQLKKKGEVVKFNPPRQTVQARHYRRFGKNERSALAEFEYLQDMSSDYSGMMSSPEVNQMVANAFKSSTLPRM